MNHLLSRFSLPSNTPACQARRRTLGTVFALFWFLAAAVPGSLFAQQPAIQSQPQSRAVFAGGTATFNVSASGSAPLSFQWYRSNGPIAGATSPTLTLPNVDLPDAGNYFVKITNTFGTVKSDDATLTVTRVDFGDAPDVYPTSLSKDGARHAIGPAMYLGAGVTFEADGLPDPNANADAGDDGVTFLTVPVPGYSCPVRVVASVTGKLDAWIDFNANGSWEDAVEQIFTSVPLSAGTNDLTFPVPSLAIPGMTYGRFRFSSMGGLRPNGMAPDGEVEDYAVRIFSAAADVYVFANLSPNPLPPPENGRGFLIITNAGPSPAPNVAITNTLSGVDFLSVQSGTLSCAVQGDKIICDPISLQPGEARVISFDFHPRQTGLLTNVLTARSDIFDPKTTNNKAVVVVRAAPPLVILKPPQSQRVLAGSSVTFFVEAKGVGPLTYQWLSNGLVVDGATSPMLRLLNVQDSAEFQVQVADTISAVLSPPATLSVVKPPQVLSQPQATSVPLGSPVQFTVQADGTAPLQFQWRLNGANIPGATNRDYFASDTTRAEGGSYTVAVANDGGVVVSEPVPLMFSNIQSTQGGDNLALRQQLPPPGLNSLQGVIQTDNFQAGQESGEPNHAQRPGGASVWFQWTAPATGIATFDTVGSTFDTLLAVYRGTNFNNLIEVASDEDRGGYFRSAAQFNVVQGQTFLIAVDGFAGRRGLIVLGWNLEQTPDVLPNILLHPQSQTGRNGQPVTLSVDVSNSPPSTQLSYQWLFNGVPITGANTSTFSIPSIKPQRVGTYTVRVGNSANRFVESRPAVLEIGSVPSIQSQDKVENVILNSSGSAGFSALSSFVGPPPFISVAFGVPGSQTLNNTNSTADIDCFKIGSATRWLGVQVTNDPVASSCTLRIETSGSAIPTELAVYRFTALSCLQSVSCMHTNIMGCDTNGAGGGGSYSLIQFTPLPNGQYMVFADGLAGAQGLINFNWQLGRPPTIIPAQSNCTVVYPSGTNITLSSGTTNAIPTPSYRWYFNGAQLTNATNNTLTFASLQYTNVGPYSVVVSNSFGIVTNTCCVIINPPRLNYQATFLGSSLTLYTISSALLPGCVLQATTNLTLPITWENLYTNSTTNCNFLFTAPLLNTNGQPFSQRYYRTRSP